MNDNPCEKMTNWSVYNLHSKLVLQTYPLRDRSQNLVGGPDANEKSSQKIFVTPLQTKKKICAPLFAMTMDQSHKKSCKLYFHWKICGKFVKVLPHKAQGFKKKKMPHFCTRPPPDKCLWMVPNIIVLTLIVVFTQPANFRKVLTFERNYNSLTCELLSTRPHTVSKELIFEMKNRKWHRFAMILFDLKFCGKSKIVNNSNSDIFCKRSVWIHAKN